MSDELRPPGDPVDDVGDELTIIIADGPDGEPIVDTVLRDRSGVGKLENQKPRKLENQDAEA